MVFLDLAFLPSRASFTPHFLKIVIEMIVSGLPHVLRQWLVVCRGMLFINTITVVGGMQVHALYQYYNSGWWYAGACSINTITVVGCKQGHALSIL